MGKLQIPENYTPVIDYMESQRAIKKIKDFFQQELELRIHPAPGLPASDSVFLPQAWSSHPAE